MAVIPFIAEDAQGHPSGARAHGARLVRWPAMDDGDSGAVYYAPDYADKSVQAIGDFTGGGSIDVEVNNENVTPTVWARAKDPQGTVISLAVTGDMSQVQPNSVAIRPRVIGAIVSVDVFMLVSTTARR